MLTIIIIILMFALIVVIHEWGHYIAAKKNGVLVHEFAVGMGPKIWSIKKGETVYSIRAFPIGGFCSMEEEIGNSSNPRAMCSKSPWQKLFIVSFGAIMNFVLAFLLLTILTGYIGYGNNVIQSIESNMPAAEANLQIGDRITAIEGNRIHKLADITALVKDRDKNYVFTIERKNEAPFNVELKARWIEKEGRARFGFTPEIVHFNIFHNMKVGFINTFQVIGQVWLGFTQLITGKVPMDQVAGIIGVADFSAKQWDTGMQSGGVLLAIMNMIYIGAVISANLGVINLLPIPALDGGRIVFILIEMLRGKPLDPEKESAVHFIGFVLLMLLTVVVLYNDIIKVFNI
ncbi:M50 family metallopeptidase [Cellulosilyticum sp. I15G10I2]|uniref:M50 family metallopeptidase n=1 Tax=Cellulosilyticum sp. I15G10I2 TaxID=1892843 RepID=UPI00085BE28C|nr:M50 family metallopeptidase [Cellulosilyticum sp. I15G10I2]